MAQTAAAGSIDDLHEEEILDAATRCAEAARRAEVELLVLAYQWAVVHSPERLDPEESRLPGRERARRYGGEGVAEVCEFAPAELGARIGRTTWSAGRLIADAQDLHHRLPLLWSRVQAGEVRASYARHVCAKTRELSPAEAAHVDAEVAEAADGRIPWTRFEALVEGKVAAAAPAVAREKEERARRARFAKKIGEPEHGMASFLVRADIATIQAIDAAVTAVAARLAARYPDDPDPEATRAGETAMSVDDRRVLALLLLVTQQETQHADLDLGASWPQATLVIHLDGRQERDLDEHGQPLERIARVEGHGPVTETWLRQVLGPHARFTVQPVFDPVGQTPVDAYEIPARHRRAVRLMTPADTFPFASCTSEHMQVDHSRAYDPGGGGGQSRIGNYGPVTLTHHRLKTHGGWQVEQPFPGIYVWRDPHGAYYLVDHSGTRRLPAADGPTERSAEQETGPAEDPRPVVVDIFRSDVELAWAA